MGIPAQDYNYTAPVPFVRPADEVLDYYDQHFTEAMVHINEEEAALSIAETTWYRYYEDAGGFQRQVFTPHNPAQAADLIGFYPWWKNYILDMREAFTKANGLLDTWGITLQEWLEDCKGYGYATWLHDTAALGTDGDLYDRDLDEVRLAPIASHFVVEAPDEIAIGVPFEVTITAYRCGAIWTDYNDRICDLTENWDGDISPTSVTDFVNGVKTFEMTATGGTPGSMRLTATDRIDPAMTGHDDITVSRPSFIVAAPSSIKIGIPFEVTITAKALGETWVGYDGTCNLTDDSEDVEIDPTSVTDFVNGVKVFNLTVSCVDLDHWIDDVTVRLTATDSVDAEMTGYDDVTIDLTRYAAEVNSLHPDGAGGPVGAFWVAIDRFHEPEGDYITRGFIKTPQCSSNKILHISCSWAFRNPGIPWKELGVYQIDPDLWTASTITWNNQPAMGALLVSATPTDAWEGTWRTFNIGSAESVCIKFKDETVPVNKWLILEFGGPYLTEA